jgi:hypothetical protein
MMMKENTTSIRPGRSPSSSFWMLFLFAVMFALAAVNGVIFAFKESYVSASCLLTLSAFILMLGIYSAVRMAMADERASSPARFPFHPWLGLSKRQAIDHLLDDSSELKSRKFH